MKPEYIEISSYQGEGYVPMVDYQSWRVAMLRYCEELEIQNLKTMQKHDETDELFILLEGEFTLFTGGKGDSVNDIDAIALEPLKIYNVKKGVWHTHTPEVGSTVLIVENQDTCDTNSPTTTLNEEQIAQLRSLYKQ